jgi:ribosome maturation factor RimP
MSRHDPIVQKVFPIIEPVCESAGFELVDLRFTNEQGSWILRAYVDRKDAEGTIDLDDCERISRELSAVLDVEDPISQAYSLEVSSPGLDRPLRTADHFRRRIGEEAKIQMAIPVPVPPERGGGERRNFRGPILAVEDDVVVVQIDAKYEFRLRLDDIDRAHLVPDWDQVMNKGQKRPAN